MLRAGPGERMSRHPRSQNVLLTFLPSVTEHRSDPDVMFKGKPVYSLRDMVQAEETGADCPEPCRMQ